MFHFSPPVCIFKYKYFLHITFLNIWRVFCRIKSIATFEVTYINSYFILESKQLKNVLDVLQFLQSSDSLQAMLGLHSKDWTCIAVWSVSVRKAVAIFGSVREATLAEGLDSWRGIESVLRCMKEVHPTAFPVLLRLHKDLSLSPALSGYRPLFRSCTKGQGHLVSIEDDRLHSG